MQPPPPYPPPAQPYPPQPPYPQPMAPPPKKKRSGCAVIALIGLAVSVPVFGILAAVAVPAFTKYMRRAKSSEARVELAKMFDAMSAYYGENGRCPGGLEGDAGLTPPASVNCNDGPKGRCVPGDAYPTAAWSDNEVWSAIGFEVPNGHYYHYNLRWSQSADGSCQFTAQAFGDLDDDGIFSTYERSGAADVNGVNSAAGLYIDREVE